MISFQGFPSFDAPNGIFRAWYFEPLVAVVFFFGWIHLWWRAERRRGLSRINDWNQALSNPWGYSWLSVFAYCLGIYVWKLFVPPAATHIPDGIPSSLLELSYLALEVWSGIVFYDFVFFFIHWSMHEIPLMRKLHHYHHAMPPNTVEARDVVHHSLGDGALQVLINILVQRQTPWGAVKSRLARILHNIIVTSMLTESHSASPEPYFWRRYFVGVREHRMHHLHDNTSRSVWALQGPGSLSRSARPFDSTDQEKVSRQSQEQKFDRHQQFFGYLDDLRFMVQEWRLRVISKRA